ncbi:hypothetical protein [Enterococcus sp. LJL90]
MQELRYALSGAQYYKKQSILTGIVLGLFIFTISLLFNLRSSAQLLYMQILQKISYFSTDTSTPFSANRLASVEEVYEIAILVTIGIFVVLMFAILFFFLKNKLAELLNWKLLGFNFWQIWGISLLELLIPLLFVCLIIVTLLSVFDSYYETLLQQINFGVLQHLTSENLANQSLAVATNDTFSVTFSDLSNSLFYINFEEGFNLLMILQNFAKSLGLVIGLLSLMLGLWQFIGLRFLTKKLR